MCRGNSCGDKASGHLSRMKNPALGTVPEGLSQHCNHWGTEGVDGDPDSGAASWSGLVAFSRSADKLGVIGYTE